MADTFSGFLNLVRPEVGGSRDAWGDKWNDNANKIDAWAQATDALAKAALSKTVGAEQAMAGVLKLSAGGTVPRAQKMVFGLGYIAETASYFEIITGDANNWRIVNNNYTAELFRVDSGGAFVKGAVVYHTSNLTPGNYADKTSGAAQRFAAPLEIAMANPYQRFVYPGVSQWYMQLQGDKYFRIYGDDDHKFQFGPDGSLWTKQFGDLNNRIEGRGAAYGNDAVNRANQYYEDRRPLRSNLGSRQEMVGDFYINKAYPTISLLYPGIKWWAMQVRENGWLYFPENDNANFNFAIIPGGNIWSGAWGGYLTDHINNRASAYATDARVAAQSYYDARSPVRANIGGRQDLAGTLAVVDYLDIVRGGVLRARWLVDGNGTTILQNGDNGDNFFYVNNGGAVWTKQFGDLNNRIEDRAYAWATDRLAVATARINNKSIRFIFAGDLNSTWNEGALNFGEPYGGAFITTMNWINQGGLGHHVAGARWRYIQMSNSDGNWYAVGYS